MAIRADPKMTLTPRPLGTTGQVVTPLTIGGGPLGSMPKNFGYEVSAAQGVSVAKAALAGPIRAIDTSSAYSEGESERRIGVAIKELGGLPEGFLLSTKISRDLATGDFSGKQMYRSIEGSLERLGLDRVPLLYLHDPENTDFESAMAPGGPVSVLISLKEQGIAQSIGVAGGLLSEMTKYVDSEIFDVLLTHNRWTLINRNARDLIERAHCLGMGVVNAAVLGGGILAKGSGTVDSYGYRPAPETVMNAIQQIEDLAGQVNCSIFDLAVQYSVNDRRIASTIVGVSRPKRIGQLVDALEVPIPNDVWVKVDTIASRIPPADLPN